MTTPRRSFPGVGVASLPFPFGRRDLARALRLSAKMSSGSRDGGGGGGGRGGRGTLSSAFSALGVDSSAFSPTTNGSTSRGGGGDDRDAQQESVVEGMARARGFVAVARVAAFRPVLASTSLGGLAVAARKRQTQSPPPPALSPSSAFPEIEPRGCSSDRVRYRTIIDRVGDHQRNHLPPDHPSDAKV